MYRLPLASVALGYRLGLGNLNQPRPCHTKACGCTCPKCVKPTKAPDAVRQPWEQEAA